MPGTMHAPYCYYELISKIVGKMAVIAVANGLDRA